MRDLFYGDTLSRKTDAVNRTRVIPFRRMRYLLEMLLLDLAYCRLDATVHERLSPCLLAVEGERIVLQVSSGGASPKIRGGER
jgi:hypothetical protein